MFIDPVGARRIEEAEAQLMRDMGGALGDLPGAFVRPLGGGVAIFVRPGSPMNKVIAAGLDAPIDEAELSEVERAFFDEGEPVRVELATLAVPETAQQLSARGYRLTGFENVLGRGISAAAPPDLRGIEIEPMTDATLPEWKRISVEGFAHADQSGVPADQHTREVIAQVLDDVLRARAVDRYLARRDGVQVGAAGMRVHEGVALLAGSTTLAEHRRRGVQSALIAWRLHEAASRGATLAIIDTAPGTQSQANVMKHGFSLAYARAILIREA
jgi:GNAT superfamily N-acetyltransferase